MKSQKLRKKSDCDCAEPIGMEILWNFFEKYQKS